VGLQRSGLSGGFDGDLGLLLRGLDLLLRAGLDLLAFADCAHVLGERVADSSVDGGKGEVFGREAEGGEPEWEREIESRGGDFGVQYGL
jgi:hypothetical protein